MILSAQTIRQRVIIIPFHDQREEAHGLSYGLGPAGYDIRIAEDVYLDAKTGWTLASVLEEIMLPTDIAASVHDKSTWARRGLSVQNTTVEPGWKGFLTLELSNHGWESLTILAGTPIAKLRFQLLDQPTLRPYAGRYQNQTAGAKPAVINPTQPGQQEVKSKS